MAVNLPPAVRERVVSIVAEMLVAAVRRKLTEQTPTPKRPRKIRHERQGDQRPLKEGRR
jgi:hypothetical protein